MDIPHLESPHNTPSIGANRAALSGVTSLPRGTDVAKLRIMALNLTRQSIVAFCATLLTGAGPLAAQTPTFKTGTRLVPLYVTVTDSQRRLVPDLVQDDFEILDDEKPQPIALFDNAIQPITVVVMLDTSGSMTANMKFVQEAGEQFLMRLLPADKARVGAFNDKIQFATDFSSNRDSLIASLRDLDFGYPTRLYDAIDASLEEMKGLEGRRVVLVFTDGDDTASRIDMGGVLDRARAEEVMIYAIGLQSDYFNGMHRVRSRPDRGLRKLAEETGGGYFELEKTADLAPTFTRVAQELHSQYVLGFTPTTLDGKIHKLNVRVKKGALNARARKSYLASAEKSSTASQ